MHTTIVYVTVKREHIEDFIEATRQNHQASVAETGNRRFDVLQASDDRTRFCLLYTSDAADDN